MKVKHQPVAPSVDPISINILNPELQVATVSSSSFERIAMAKLSKESINIRDL